MGLIEIKISDKVQMYKEEQYLLDTVKFHYEPFYNNNFWPLCLPQYRIQLQDKLKKCKGPPYLANKSSAVQEKGAIQLDSNILSYATQWGYSFWVQRLSKPDIRTTYITHLSNGQRKKFTHLPDNCMWL